MARIVVTTSHRPSQRVRSFAKDLAAVLPHAVKVNRGKSSLQDLYYDAVGYGAERVIVVGVWKGNPGLLRVYEVVTTPPDHGLKPLSEIFVAGVTLRREIPGSQKIMTTMRLAIDATSIDKRLEPVVDVLSKSFLASIVFDEDRLERFDVAARLSLRDRLELEFFCTGTWRYCGPRIRVAKIVDYSGGSIYVFRGGVYVERATDSRLREAKTRFAEES